MPYPNSQTPVTMRLNEMFNDPANTRRNYLPQLLNALTAGTSLAQIALQYNVVGDQWGYDHVNAWPSDQQQLLRAEMIYALTKGIAMSFDWQNAPNTSTDIVHLKRPRMIGVTFRSPLEYPPYWNA